MSYPTPELEPAIMHTAPWRVTSVTTLPHARLQVLFVDGTAGEVHIKSFLIRPAVNQTVFEQLRDPGLFAQAQVVLGAVQWPNDAISPPIALYEPLREHGVWVLD
jgi:Protein of unknown function (DUF2442)